MRLKQFVLRSSFGSAFFFPASDTAYYSVCKTRKNGTEVAMKVKSELPNLEISTFSVSALENVLTSVIGITEVTHEMIERAIIGPSEALLIFHNLNFETNLTFLNLMHSSERKSKKFKRDRQLLWIGLQELSKIGDIITSFSHPLATIAITLKDEKFYESLGPLKPLSIIAVRLFEESIKKQNRDQWNIYNVLKKAKVETPEDIFLVSQAVFNPISEVKELITDIGLENAINITDKFVDCLIKREKDLLKILREKRNVKYLRDNLDVPSSKETALLAHRYYLNAPLLKQHFLSFYPNVEDKILSYLLDFPAVRLEKETALRNVFEVLVDNGLIKLSANILNQFSFDEKDSLLFFYDSKNPIDVVMEIDHGSIIFNPILNARARCATIATQCITSFKFWKFGAELECPFNFGSCPLTLDPSMEIFSCMKDAKIETKPNEILIRL